jgi:NAD(P)-dependent dehydrogenase (short-subunit alcohol dehydrogenase family)
MSAFDLDGKVICLTGAGGYLGTAISEAVLAAGAQLIMVGRSRERLEALREHFGDARERCHPIAGDVTSATAIAGIRQSIADRFGALHGLVNNAYSGRVGTLDAIEESDFEAATRYSLIAPFSMIRSMRPLMERAFSQTSQSASVVNVASMYGSVSPDPSLYGDSGKNNPVHYGASKAGLVQMTRYLACHLGSSGIRVNSISPGPFPNTAVDPGIPGFYERLAAKVPMGRVGKPPEVAGPVVFLLSDAASYINGVDLPIDGGWTAW